MSFKPLTPRLRQLKFENAGFAFIEGRTGDGCAAHGFFFKKDQKESRIAFGNPEPRAA